MRLKTTAATVGVSVLSLLSFGGVAMAAQATGSIAPAQVSPTGGTVTVNYNTDALNSNVLIQLCSADFNAVSGAFDPAFDCSPVNAITPATNAQGDGTAQFSVWAGTELNQGAFTCGPGGQATCYVRIVPGAVETATSEDVFFPVTYNATAPSTTTTVVPNAEVPEAPMGVLLPLTAAGLVGGGLIIARRRARA